MALRAVVIGTGWAGEGHTTALREAGVDVMAMCGEGYSGYPTFRDGWIASEIIEIVLSNQSWTALPKHPTNGDL
jgi:ketol-acid reductoisomerase